MTELNDDKRYWPPEDDKKNDVKPEPVESGERFTFNDGVYEKLADGSWLKISDPKKLDPWMELCYECDNETWKIEWAPTLYGQPVTLCTDCYELWVELEVFPDITEWYAWYYNGCQGPEPMTGDRYVPGEAKPARPAKDILADTTKNLIYGGELGGWVCNEHHIFGQWTSEIASCWNNHPRRVARVLPYESYRLKETT